MFNNPVKPSYDTEEGIVTQVDPIRKHCKVKTMTGQNLEQVQWLEPVGNSSRMGDRLCPVMGDRVKLSYGLGHPVIEGTLPKLQTSDLAFPVNIDTGIMTVDTGDYSPGGGTIIGDTNKPGDLMAGDRVIASTGGGLLAVLRGGSILLRSSRLSEIFLCKWDDLVRIVSRNWEHYTDVSSDIVKNLRGRIYRYTGYTNSFSDSKNESYPLNFYYGDTAIAESVKTNWASPPSTIPATNAILYKEQVTSGGSEVMHRTLDTSGDEEIKVTNGSVYTQTNLTPSQVTITYNGQNTIVINSADIIISRSDGAVITLDASGIRAVFGSGEINMSSAGVNTTFGSHFMNVTSSGVQLG